MAAPDEMGLGPLPASRKALQRAELGIEQMQVVELNEAFASQALAVLRDLGIPDDATHRQLHDKAHHECFIANSVRCEMTVEPEMVRA